MIFYNNSFNNHSISGTNALREGSYFGGWEKTEPTDVWEEDVPEGEGAVHKHMSNYFSLPYHKNSPIKCKIFNT